MTWKADGESVLRGYKFSYDGLNRLTSSVYGEGTAIASNLNRYTENMTYDKMGNILSVKRYGKLSATIFDLIDDLSLSYTGNQLQKVTDQVAQAIPEEVMHFTDDNNSNTEYTYDSNGNLTSDLNKNISKIEYNVLNLPEKITFSNGGWTGYVYDSGGKKLRVTHHIGQTTSVTDYAGSMIYENGILSKVLTENGYVSFSGTTPAYHYYLTDHLGNNRLVMNASGSVEQVNHYYPFGGMIAESTGGEVQSWKFGGKELDRKKGLDWADFGTRQYDPLIAGWTVFDPLAEKYYSCSPYAYCLNNPVKYIDPNGEKVWLYYKDENGEQQKIEYSANMDYTGDNTFVSNIVSYLNSIYNNSGDKVLNRLIGSNNDFNFKNQRPVDNEGNSMNALSFVESTLGGGDIYAGAIMASGMTKYQKVESLSHELFHGLQHEEGQGGAFVFNEVEANIYSAIIASEWSNSSGYSGAMSTNGMDNGTAAGNIYRESFNSLTRNGFTKSAFINCVTNFRRGSSANVSGAYNNYPNTTNQKRYLLKTYYPNKK